eukprot:scaffold24493_cov18-Tisochrysis_lutea.AAC.2
MGGTLEGHGGDAGGHWGLGDTAVIPAHMSELSTPVTCCQQTYLRAPDILEHWQPHPLCQQEGCSVHTQCDKDALASQSR